MSKKKSLTSEERVAAVQEYLDGKGGYKAIARKYNIGATTMKSYGKKERVLVSKFKF